MEFIAMLTERGTLSNILAQKIARGYGRELWEALEHALSLGSFPDAWGADKDNAGSATEVLYHARRMLYRFQG